MGVDPTGMAALTYADTLAATFIQASLIAINTTATAANTILNSQALVNLAFTGLAIGVGIEIYGTVDISDMLGVFSDARGDLVKLTDYEEQLLVDNGIHPHDLKPEPHSRFDLYKDKDTGKIYHLPKGGQGEAGDRYVNVEDLKR